MTTRKAIRPNVRFATLERCGFRCAYCGAKASDTELEIDHIVPVSRGGGNDPANLIVACRECNAGKSDRPLRALPELPPIRLGAVETPIINPPVQNHREWEREEAIAANLIRFLEAKEAAPA